MLDVFQSNIDYEHAIQQLTETIDAVENAGVIPTADEVMDITDIKNETKESFNRALNKGESTEQDIEVVRLIRRAYNVFKAKYEETP